MMKVVFEDGERGRCYAMAHSVAILSSVMTWEIEKTLKVLMSLAVEISRQKVQMVPTGSFY